jgi:large subunit ribosomal protein L21
MYAVIETGGKQYRVELGTELEVELLEAEPGGSLTLDRVLLVADGESATIGRPLVENASVAAEVLRQIRGEKVISFKYRPKARRRVKKGHRQELMVLRISDIVLDGKSAAAREAKAADDRKTERERLEEAAKRQAEADAALAAKLAKAAAPKVETLAKAEAPAKVGRAKPTAAKKPAAAAKASAAAKAAAPAPKAKAAPKPSVPAPKAKAAPKADAAPAPKVIAVPKAEAAPKKTPARNNPEAKPTAAPAATKPARSRSTKKDE